MVKHLEAKKQILEQKLQEANDATTSYKAELASVHS
jgi:hypothetical protein